jgi:hypothetical protein
LNHPASQETAVHDRVIPTEARRLEGSAVAFLGLWWNTVPCPPAVVLSLSDQEISFQYGSREGTIGRQPHRPTKPGEHSNIGIIFAAFNQSPA